MEGRESAPCSSPLNISKDPWTVTNLNVGMSRPSFQKIARKEYAKLTGRSLDDGVDGDAVENGGGGSDDDGKKKKPSFTRQMKGRLQKLVAKTDDTYVYSGLAVHTHLSAFASGRVLSTEFVELPSKKLWPVYYKTIARPICFEDIFVRITYPTPIEDVADVRMQKRLKRKEYSTSNDFAKDVELVFDNAIQFNADHTPIWEDAQQLRVCCTFA